jgi:hypothetical protein
MTHSGQPRMNIRRCVLGAFLRDLSQAQQFFERVESFGLVSLIAREDFGQNFGGALMGKPHVVEYHVQRRDARGRKTPWLWNAGLRLPRGPHVSSRGPWLSSTHPTFIPRGLLADPLVQIPVLRPVNRRDRRSRIALRIQRGRPRRDHRYRKNHSEDECESIWFRCHVFLLAPDRCRCSKIKEGLKESL